MQNVYLIKLIRVKMIRNKETTSKSTVFILYQFRGLSNIWDDFHLTN